MRPALIGGALLPLLLGAAAPSSPGEAYAERAAKLEGKKDAKAWLKLADFAEEQLLWKEREAALRKVLDQDPENAKAHARLDEARAGKEWLPAEEAEAREAAENQAKGLVLYGTKWVSSKEADKFREADRKEVGWDLDFRVDTPHLRIYSAVPLPLTRRLAAILENEVGVYRKAYDKTFKLDPKPTAFKVYLFGDEDTMKRVFALENGYDCPVCAGVYSDTSHIAYLFLDRRILFPEMGLLSTATHEMVHAFDHLVAHVYTSVRNLPSWFLEGRADYYFYSIHGRRILPGLLAVHNDILENLAGAIDGADLRELMGLDQESFSNDKDGHHYALSWAWVHFLFHAEGGKYAPGFRTYLQGIPGKASTAHFERAVGKLSDLEPAFKHYVKEEMIPSGKASRQGAVKKWK